uniref:Dimer_Tnp_hAT domain-containing protein n=1 Tax=Angiostrongylus cantonensis TaxID=6313 RepID=A0A0K0D5M6_ANGCA
MGGTTIHPELVFAPFIAPDEGSAISFEYAKALEKIRVWESSDSIPFHLYQTMKLRLYNGMDKIDNDTPLLSIMQGMADQIPKNWTQWLLNSARIQDGYCDMFKENDVSDDVEMVADDDDILIPEKSATRSEEHCHLLSLNVKGLPGILQLSTLESESDVVWHNCDSNHFTYIKVSVYSITLHYLKHFLFLKNS